MMGLPTSNIRSSVRGMHRAGVPILAGTDANTAMLFPRMCLGDSLHALNLLLDAVLSPVRAFPGSYHFASQESQSA
ncbi:hypothetical protein N7510_002751 [Penicillium lagena]|uniref:uncharacterized protein n=1 Tax=Penicillium lagena TaxID=94218 RepID=UPI00253F6606|nr:uncharacterized protein N7510_002751 [Penicillium lagena]KAJ5618767.1 hypothetical protein N7510_002751 [Penicillium lagena]